MNNLLNKLKAEDKFVLRLSKGLQIVYWILIPIYTILFVFIPDADMTIYERLGGVCFVLAFLVFALVFRHRVKTLKGIDYSVSTIQMLDEAADRYKLWKPEFCWVILTVFLIDVGLSISSYYRLEVANWLDRILLVQYILIPAVLVSLSIGIVWWYLKHKPLRDHALKLLDELKS